MIISLLLLILHLYQQLGYQLLLQLLVLSCMVQTQLVIFIFQKIQVLHGHTATTPTGATTMVWVQVVCSDDGLTAYAIGTTSTGASYLYKTTNTGTTWTLTYTGISAFTSISMS